MKKKSLYALLGGALLLCLMVTSAFASRKLIWTTREGQLVERSVDAQDADECQAVIDAIGLMTGHVWTDNNPLDEEYDDYVGHESVVTPGPNDIVVEVLGFSDE